MSKAILEYETSLIRSSNKYVHFYLKNEIWVLVNIVVPVYLKFWGNLKFIKNF